MACASPSGVASRTSTPFFPSCMISPTPPRVQRHHRQTKSHRSQQGASRSFLERRKNEKISRRVNRFDVGNKAREYNRRFHTGFPRPLLQLRAQAPVPASSSRQVPASRASPQFRERLDQQAHALFPGSAPPRTPARFRRPQSPSAGEPSRAFRLELSLESRRRRRRFLCARRPVRRPEAVSGRPRTRPEFSPPRR